MGEKNEKLKSYETSILRRVECEKKAFDIVNKLIDGVVEEYYLIQCGRLISREHYSDIVEERAITMLCGYPICGNSLNNVPKKKYQISTKTNKVYDISESKNFCSNQCFKASKYFSNQIPESPLWAREKEILPDIKLLSVKMDKGFIGEEIVGESPRQLLKEELTQLEELDTKMSSLHIAAKPQGKNTKTLAVAARSVKPTHVPPSPEVKETLNVKGESIDSNSTASQNNVLMVASSSVSGQGNCDNNNSRQSTCDVSNVVQCDHKPVRIVPPGTIAATHDSVKEKKEKNITIECAQVLTTPSCNTESKLEQLQKILARKKGVLPNMIVDMQPTFPQTETVDAIDVSTQGAVKTTSVSLSCGQSQIELRECTTENVTVKEMQGSSECKPSFQLPLQQILSALRAWVTERTRSYLFLSTSEKDDISSFSDPRLQKDYADLCRRLVVQEKEFESLLHGDNESEDTQTARLKSVPDYDLLKKENAAFQLKVVEFITGKKPECNKSTDEADDDDTNPVFLPTVDTYDQQQIRMKIVLYQLDKVIPSLLTPLSLPVQFISTLIRELVSTFSLQKDTIVFKPSEWTLVAIFLLKMLSRKSKPICEAFSAESATKYFSILLSGIGYTLENFDDRTNEILSYNVK